MLAHMGTCANTDVLPTGGVFKLASIDKQQGLTNAHHAKLHSCWEFVFVHFFRPVQPLKVESMFTSTRASTKESKAELVGRRVKRFVVVFVGCRGSGKDYGRKTTKVPLCLGEQKKSLTHCGQIQKRQVEHYKRPDL